MTTDHIEDAGKVLAVAAPLPDATMTSPGPAAPVASGPATLPDKDLDGLPHDPKRHESPPRLNAERRWAKLRGNAARKAQGLPPTGRTFGPAKPAPAVDPAAEQPAPAAPAPEPPPSVSTPPPAAMLGGGAPVHDGVVDPEQVQRPFADYATTAAGLVDGTLGLAVIGISDAWKATPQERTVLVGAVQRVCHEHQLPVLGSLVELVLVVIGFAAKRRTDADTMSLIRRLFRRDAPRPVDPHATPDPTPPARTPAPVVMRRASAWD